MASPLINTCTIKVYLLDLVGFIPIISASNPPKLYVSAAKHFFHGPTLVLPFSVSTDFDTSGKAEIDVIETETPEEPLEFFVTIPETYSTRVIGLVPAIVPNESECPITKITITKPFGFS